MTFDNAPSAIDGAQLNSALIRRSTFAGVNGASGVVLKNDLKVTQLGTPGVGIQISAGVGLVVNGYQSTPNETYVVSNPGVHTVPSGSMPASNPAAQSYLVAVVVGDPAFSQSSHPWMLSTDPTAGTALTFQYVRVTLVPCSAGQTTLPAGYPGLVLARMDIPANTTTIIDSYITDLRALAQPRFVNQIYTYNSWTNGSPVYIPSASAYAAWGSYAPTIPVPLWAKRAVVIADLNGIRLVDSSVNVTGGFRVKLGSTVGPATAFDLPVGSGQITLALKAALDFDVSAIAGTNVVLGMEGFENAPASPTTNQRLRLQGGTQLIVDVRFFEA